ncbi:hypothetical protein [Natronorubrum halalkaliphilum]|nr:hypothetical protein [Natronorubrum halalkaliphilum]
MGRRRRRREGGRTVELDADSEFVVVLFREQEVLHEEQIRD